MRQSSKVTAVLIHVLILLPGMLLGSDVDGIESSTVPSTTLTAAHLPGPENTANKTTIDPVVSTSSSVDPVNTSEAVISTSIEVIDHTLAKPDSSTNEDFFSRVYKRAKYSLNAIPAFLYVWTTTYFYSYGICPTDSDDFWTEERCNIGFFLFLTFLTLIAPIWFVIGPIVFFVFDLGNITPLLENH